MTEKKCLQGSTEKTKQKEKIEHLRLTVKFLNFRTPDNFAVKLPKIQTTRPNHGIFCPKDANGIANSEDPDQTAPLGAVWSGSALFAQTYLSENLGSLRYAEWPESTIHSLVSALESQSGLHVQCIICAEH